MADSLENLTGHMLIGMPGMADPRFFQSVVYICDHSAQGAMGLITNKLMDDLTMSELLAQLEIEPHSDVDKFLVCFGGPVETGRGFVLHSADYESDLRTLSVSDEISLTPTLDILEDIAIGQGPRKLMMMLGYAGWGPGQLEGEIAQNGWLTCEGSPDIVFDTSTSDKWGKALRKLGIDPSGLSAAAGRA